MRRRQVAAAAAAGPRLRVWTAAIPHLFVVCGADRKPVWHARFHRQLVIDSDREAAELAALQGLWLAGKAREDYGAGGARVSLVLAYSHTVDLDALDLMAIECGLLLDLTVDRQTNPALAYCRGSRIRTGWRTADLTTLIDHQQDTP
ncbi:hypothetical protein ABIA39_007541 [Nocardia sp. GAS34]|uniref:hypothetical protein n=1 Tax=unclassified Nocardia TaxID=2637762 RepID=UPI003D222C2C